MRLGDDERVRLPSPRSTSIRSPGWTSSRWMKAPGRPFQSTWPASTAAPASPGVAPNWYQPTWAGSAGTESSPVPWSTPTGTTWLTTSCAGDADRDRRGDRDGALLVEHDAMGRHLGDGRRGAAARAAPSIDGVAVKAGRTTRGPERDGDTSHR